MRRDEAPRLEIRMFEHFEALVDDVPLSFERTKARELLALLVDRQGLVVPPQEAAAALWEGRPWDAHARSYYQTVAASLRRTLGRAGVGKALVKTREGMAVAPGAVDCDLYRLLQGESVGIAAQHGRYLPEFLWSELGFSAVAIREVRARHARPEGIGPRGQAEVFMPRQASAGHGRSDDAEPPEERCQAADLPRYTRHLTERYYHKDYEPMLRRMTGDVVFIGAGPDVTFGLEELLTACDYDAAMPSFRMENERFELSSLSAAEADATGLAVVTGIYDLYSEGDKSMLTATHQRLTALFRWEEDGWRIFYVHASNEWSELMGDEVFPVQVSRQTYDYVRRALRKSMELARQRASEEQRGAGNPAEIGARFEPSVE